MARYVTYKYKGQSKRIAFSFDKFRDMYEAAAAAEGVDLKAFLAMERQVAALSRQGAAMKDYRKNEFKRLGFTELFLHKDEDEESQR